MSNNQDSTGPAGNVLSPGEVSPGEVSPGEVPVGEVPAGEVSPAVLSSAVGDGLKVHRDNGIDTIRDLLRKLEDAAEGLPSESPRTDEGSAGNPGFVVGNRPSDGWIDASTSHRRRHSVGWVIGAGSFALGVSAAAGLLIALDPFKSSRMPQHVIAQAPVSVSTEPIVAAAQPAARGSGEVRKETGEDGLVPERLVQSTVAPSSTRVMASEQEATSASTFSMVRSVVAKPVTFVLSTIDALEMRPGDRQSLNLRLTPMPTDSDALLVVMRGVPAWLNVSKGSTIGEEIWLMPGHQASDLSLIAAENGSGSADILIQLVHLDGRILAEQRLSVRASRASKPTPMVAAVPEAGEQNTLRMLARGELLLDTGEIEAARLLLRTAAEGGSVAAALKLAQTYDPAEMQRLGMADASADPTQAVRWYQRAHALGSPAASARISALSAR